MSASSAPRSAPNVRRLPPAGSRKYGAMVDAAEQLFGAHGFKDTNVDAIASLAGVSKPLIYRYFSSKDELYELVVDRIVTQWCDAIIHEAERSTPTVAHNLRGVVAASIGFARDRPFLGSLLALENQLMLHEYSDVLARGTQTLRGVFVGLLQLGVDGGELRDDLTVEHMAIVLTEVCEAFANRVMADPSADDPTLLDATIETLLYGLVAPPRPPVET